MFQIAISELHHFIPESRKLELLCLAIVADGTIVSINLQTTCLEVQKPYFCIPNCAVYLVEQASFKSYV